MIVKQNEIEVLKATVQSNVLMVEPKAQRQAFLAEESMKLKEALDKRLKARLRCVGFKRISLCVCNIW